MPASRGMGQDFKALLRNGLPARNTEPKGSVLDPCQRQSNHLYFSQSGIAQFFEDFITFPFGSALLNIGVSWFVQVLLDFPQSFIQFVQAIPQLFFIFPRINRFHYVQPCERRCLMSQVKRSEFCQAAVQTVMLSSFFLGLVRKFSHRSVKERTVFN